MAATPPVQALVDRHLSPLRQQMSRMVASCCDVATLWPRAPYIQTLKTLTKAGHIPPPPSGYGWIHDQLPDDTSLEEYLVVLADHRLSGHTPTTRLYERVYVSDAGKQYPLVAKNT